MSLVRAERWQYLLAPLGQTRFWVAFRTTVIGFAASFVLPARAGEVLRPYLLARSEGLPATAAFATIIVERMLDLLAVLILLGGVLPRSCRAARRRRRRRSIARCCSAAPIDGAGRRRASWSRCSSWPGIPSGCTGSVLKIERVLPARIAHAVAGFAKTFAEGLAVVRQPVAAGGGDGVVAGAVAGDRRAAVGAGARVRHRAAVWRARFSSPPCSSSASPCRRRAASAARTRRCGSA